MKERLIKEKKIYENNHINRYNELKIERIEKDIIISSNDLLIFRLSHIKKLKEKYYLLKSKKDKIIKDYNNLNFELLKIEKEYENKINQNIKFNNFYENKILNLEELINIRKIDIMKINKEMKSIKIILLFKYEIEIN